MQKMFLSVASPFLQGARRIATLPDKAGPYGSTNVVMFEAAFLHV
jgi:hypothetical protein